MLTAREAWIAISLVVGMQMAYRLKMLPTLLLLRSFQLITFLLLLGLYYRFIRVKYRNFLSMYSLT